MSEWHRFFYLNKNILFALDSDYVTHSVIHNLGSSISPNWKYWGGMQKHFFLSNCDIVQTDCFCPLVIFEWIWNIFQTLKITLFSLTDLQLKLTVKIPKCPKSSWLIIRDYILMHRFMSGKLQIEIFIPYTYTLYLQLKISRTQKNQKQTGSSPRKYFDIKKI